MRTDRLFRFRQEEDGAVAVIVSLMLVVLLGFTALGVDVASLYRERAQLQSVADLTAVSAMAVPDDATGRAEYVLSRNGKAATVVETLQTGRYLRNPAIPAGDRFTALSQGSAGINAVRVVLKDDAALHFARIFSQDASVTLDRTALATRTGAASFALDSHILQLDSTNLNAVLTSQFGASAAIDLGVIDVLADLSINTGGLLDALDIATGGPRRNPADILNETITSDELVAALQSQLPASLGSALTGLRGAAGSASFDVASLIGGIDTGLGLTATDFIGEVDVTALDIVRALVIAQNTGAATDLETDAEIAGIVSLHTSLTAGEPEARSGLIAMGEEGVQLHRAAVRLDTELSLEPDLLTGLGIGVSVAQIHLPIYAEIAGSTATLEQIGCNVTVPSAVAARFSTAATPLHPANGTSVAALYLGALPTGPGPINPADLGFADLIDVNIVIDLGLLPDIHVSGLTIQGRSMVTVGASMTESVTFTMADVAAGDTVRSFGSGTLVSSAANGLLSPENTEFRVKPGQSGLVSGLAEPVVNTLLASLPNRLVQDLAVPVDAALDTVLDSTGLQLGVGEISLIEHHCEAIQLVR